MNVDPTNAGQAQAWDGDEGGYWATHADRFDRSLARYQPEFMAAAGIRPGSAVLDIGCGTGETTRAAVRAGAASAVGIDLSADMIAVASSRALPGTTFVQGDAQIHPFPDAAFDGAISRTGAMFFGDPGRAFANIARALAPGSPLTLLVWQPPDRNEWIGALAGALAGGPPPAPPPGAPGPFSLSDPSVVRAVLAEAGFGRIEVTGVSAPMHFGSDVDDAHRFVLGLLGWMLEGRDEAGRRAAGDRLRDTLADHLTPEGVAFASATWLVTAVGSGGG
ncbi:class I SAM-dependent methyltransferase [Virgisporangium ochraceum]|uniref:Methyltransferase n=1 Tax=Virgisporangium ochraceum TaxID=65505 RepID=A0A8J4EFQ7_9ACTN|nr:class I SAM-dependent methyltransferase [Virgisporangium ochraceum]GIJ73089.1 methyltransferase [Virgisporangium ochraceum]